jgi:hypothetical protein
MEIDTELVCEGGRWFYRETREDGKMRESDSQDSAFDAYNARRSGFAVWEDWH